MDTISTAGALFGLAGFLLGGLTCYLYINQPWNK